MSRIIGSTAALLTVLAIVMVGCGEPTASESEVAAKVITSPVSHWDRLPPEFDLIGPRASAAGVSIEDALAHELEGSQPDTEDRPTAFVSTLPVR